MRNWVRACVARLFSTFRPVGDFGLSAVAEACQHFGAMLRRDDPEAYPSIECEVDPTGSVGEVVERVAESVDRVFHLALRDDLK